MKVVRDINQVDQAESKRIPLYKNEVLIARFTAEFIAEHNAKIRRKIKKPNAGTLGH